MRNEILILVLISVISISQHVWATTVEYNDFADTSALTLSSGVQPLSTGDGNVLRLTSADPWQHGSAFGTEQVNAAGFSTHFSFRITDSGGQIWDPSEETGADGIVFVVQNKSAAIGGAGEGIGYRGIGNSLGVEFDTWNNQSPNNDPDSNHIGMNQNGVVQHDGSLPTAYVNDHFDNGNLWHSWIDYDGTTLEVRAGMSGIRPEAAILAAAVNIPELLGQDNAWVGFTSGTGLAWGNHDIVTWEYRDHFSPIDTGTSPVPEPGTMALLGVGLLGLAGVGRRTI